ncbi:hypothetical protein DL96DRAFT_1587827 [Flagelloscypha sp. PMI_526]|nr:hypothetical protein DL96DRAFT_1587827 [Flagelloscypha sp. PMI_526]
MSVMTIQSVSVAFSGAPRQDYSDSVFHVQSNTRKTRGRSTSGGGNSPRPRMPRGHSYTPLYARRSSSKDAPSKPTGDAKGRDAHSQPRGKRPRNPSHSGTRRSTQPPVEPVPQDVNMDELQGMDPPQKSVHHSEPLADILNFPPSPPSTGLKDNRSFERRVLQPLTSTSPPGLPVPPVHRPLPAATWHRMGISTSEYMFLLRKINPHTTHVMSQFNPDRRFLHPAFLEPPANYSLHKVPTYKRTMVKWDQSGSKWETSGKHQRRDDWFGFDKTWVPCSQREPLCGQWRNSRCATCTSSARALHNRVLVNYATDCEEARLEQQAKAQEELKMDPFYCQDAEMDSPSALPSFADELLTTTKTVSAPTEDIQPSTDITAPEASLDTEVLVCPPTPRPQSFDEFDDDDSEDGGFF